MSAQLFLTSGDLIADRRYDYARDLLLRGDVDAAIDLLAQAVERAPGFASAWFLLGELHAPRGERDAAIEAFRRAQNADPEDRHGAALRLTQIGAETAAPMPPGYVRALFDQYAPRFERDLVQGLGYRAPALLFDAVMVARKASGGPARFRCAIDLGCGTGLAAREFSAIVDRFVGCDLSPGMAALACASGLYSSLTVGDMHAALANEPDASADLVLAADAVVYLLDLAPLFALVARVLQPGGLFAFTTETHDGDGAILKPTLRYAHAPACVADAIAKAGLTLRSLEPHSTRNEERVPVPGLVAVAEKP